LTCHQLRNKNHSNQTRHQTQTSKIPEQCSGGVQAHASQPPALCRQAFPPFSSLLSSDEVQLTDDSLSLFIAVGWSWKMLDCLLNLFSAAMSQRCAFFPVPRGFL
jgi:hypothetical protein